MCERKYKVTIEYEIVTTSTVDKTTEEVAETVAYRAKELGYGANMFWRIDWDTLDVTVTDQIKPLTRATTWLSSIRKFWELRRD